jgi:hypothetical protein
MEGFGGALFAGAGWFSGGGMSGAPLIQSFVAPGQKVPFNPVSEQVAGLYGGGGSGYGLGSGMGGFYPLPPVDRELLTLGINLWRQMLCDPKCSSAVTLLRDAAIADGIQLAPTTLRPMGVSKKSESDSRDPKKCQIITDFCKWSTFDHLETAIEHSVWEFLEGVAFGNKLSEIVCDFVEGGEYAGKLAWSELRAKPYGSYAYVVDPFLKVTGIQTMVPFKSQMDGHVEPHSGELVIVDKRKFLIFSFNTFDSDPRGVSCLRPAYQWWNLKSQLLPYLSKYIQQFASPSLVGKVPENASDREKRDSNGNVIPGQFVSATQDLFDQIVNFQGGTALALPFGTELEPLQVAGNGDVFDKVIDLCDRQITAAILGQTRATEEARFGSKADSGTGKDILGLVVQRVKSQMCSAIRQGLHTLVELNWGKEDADLYTPYVEAGNHDREDRAAYWVAASNLARSGYLSMSQLPMLDAKLGLPARHPDDNPNMLPTNLDQTQKPGTSRTNAPSGDAGQAKFIQGMLLPIGD